MFLKYCKKHDIYHLLSECPVCKSERTVKSLDDVDIRKRLKTFSDLDIPVLVMCPPIIQKLYIDNNVWMEQFDEQMKKYFSYEKLFLQWYQIWQTLSMEALCLTLPADPTLQDTPWVNSFVWLPHVEEPTIVLSNFKAEGRSREIDIAKTFLETCGYKTYQIPDPEWFFEGFPDLKWLYDNIYVAGFGERTTEQALDWIAEKFDCKIIKVARTTPENYHADTVLCPISPTKVMCVIPDCDKKALKELEKYAEIIPIEDKKLGEYCITNNIVIGYTIYAGTYLDVFEPDTEDWEIEMRKLEKLQEIAINHGYDLVVFETGQFLAFGAALSCTATPLNYGNQWTSQKVWSEYGNK